MSERMVKGTMLLDQVRAIRANKDLDWSGVLEPEDWEIVDRNILAASWYPIEWYEKCGWATFQVLARGDVELARLSGRTRGEELFRTTYKALTLQRDPMKALERFVLAYGLLFNFSALEFERIDDGHARIRHEYDSDHPTTEPYCYLLMGHIESLIELTGGANPQIELTAKRWRGDPRTIFDITWD